VTAKPDYSVVESEPVFAGRILSLRVDHVRMSDGTVVDREVVDHIGAVAVLALDADDSIVMVNQYRHPIGERLDELPAGLLDVDGEPALDAARRELAEEADLTAARWDVLLDLYPSPGFSSEAIRVFLARDLAPVPERDRFVREHEEITMTVHRVPLDQAVRRALAGAITNASAVAGILAAAQARAAAWTSLRPADSPWPARPGR
jgi:8-oxo-dGTP pyrophosphatase MutT (NUDIX family)